MLCMFNLSRAVWSGVFQLLEQLMLCMFNVSRGAVWCGVFQLLEQLMVCMCNVSHSVVWHEPDMLILVCVSVAGS